MFIEAGAESVNEGDGTDVQACLVHMGRTGAVGLQSLCDHPQKDAQHHAQHRSVALHEVPQPLGHGEHPLAHRQAGEYVIVQVRCCLHHAPGGARGADSTAFAGEGYKVVVPTVAAASAGKAMGKERIRYRIDGLLRQIRALHKSYWPAMAVRIKVMAGLNIAETRAPQDGRISLSVSGRPVDFRVSTQPTIHGENIVLRVLDRQKGIVGLHELGLSDARLELLKLMIARPEGLILVTGPTGSGKTTTLYSILGHINAEGINIMTLEDPVEYPMAQIRQTAVSDAARLDFANGVRAMLRQDPDVILVGEIRDGDTARMAFQAAMTGHQVYSTLHTSSAIGAIPRLLDLGIVPDILAGNLIGIVAQRLIRRLCPHCREAYPAADYEMRLLGSAGNATRPTLFRATGCPQCDFQGYRGRLAIMELLRLDPDLDELIARRATARELQHAAASRGFTRLADDGTRRVLDGDTSLEELARVVDLTERLVP